MLRASTTRLRDFTVVTRAENWCLFLTLVRLPEGEGAILRKIHVLITLYSPRPADHTAEGSVTNYCRFWVAVEDFKLPAYHMAA